MDNKTAVWIVMALVVGAIVVLFVRQTKGNNTTPSNYRIKTDEELKKYLNVGV